MSEPCIRVFLSHRAETRARELSLWLEAHPRATVVGASREAAPDVVRSLVRDQQADRPRSGALGLERTTFPRLALALAEPELLSQAHVPSYASGLVLDAVCARLVRVNPEALGRFAALADKPGLARALSRTLEELRAHGLDDGDLGPAGASLPALAEAWTRTLEAERLVSQARLPLPAKSRNLPPHAFADVAIDTPFRAKLVRAIAETGAPCAISLHDEDERSLRAIVALFGDGATIVRLEEGSITSRLRHVQATLFEHRAEATPPVDDSVEIFSAPGEGREVVEIARRILGLAARGTPFDRVAVFLRNPEAYAGHLEEAFSRAKVPAFFARGTRRPDPRGRALIALLACAEEGLSARRFSEYLSLGVLPDRTDRGEPPPAIAAAEAWVPPDDDALAEGADTAAETEAEELSSSRTKELVAPRRWEELLGEASVIGTEERWQRRLEGLEASLRLEHEGLVRDDDPRKDVVLRDIAHTTALRAFAIPLIRELQELRSLEAPWSVWLERLAALATRTVEAPSRILSVLAELAPLRETGPVRLDEVRLVLEPRLCLLVVPPSGKRYGKVYIAPIDDARGLSFDTVFVPGLAERGFPKKISQDPIVDDGARARLDGVLAKRGWPLGLPVNTTRAEAERTRLLYAVSAASSRLVVSYPRLDVEQGRPRTPSFYALETLRASRGGVPGFEELARVAGEAARARVGWPAPDEQKDAIDEAEHDLALLARVLEAPEAENVGTARYLLSANPHLARALRFRGRRWLRTWSYADGLVDPSPLAKEALAKHGLGERSFSPTALQTFASCPYRFLLYAVHKLGPRRVPEGIEEMDPLQKGSLVHEVLFRLNVRLRDQGLLPVTAENLAKVRTVLDQTVDAVADETKDDLFPSIERVWDDGIAQIRADLRELCRRTAEDRGWQPAYFELAFGLGKGLEGRDAASNPEAIPLDCGIKLRGSIDLVEASDDGALRATDYKTGKQRATEATVIGGGETLQPVFYALVLEKMFPEKKITSGRLYYATSAGGFSVVDIPLGDVARESANALADTLKKSLETGFLPAAPSDKACDFCDFRTVCGPYEQLRTAKKKKEPLMPLLALRRRA